MRTVKFLLIFLMVLFVGLNGAYAQTLEDAKHAIDSERYEKAIKYLRNLVKNNTLENSQPYYYLGYVLLLTDRDKEAKNIFEKGIKLYPKESIGYVGMGTYYAAKKDIKKMSENFTKALSMRKRKDYLVSYYIGKSFISFERYQKPDSALVYFEKSMKYAKEFPDLYVKIGDAYALKKDNSEAIKNYEKALRENPKLYSAILSKGVIWKMAYNWDASIKEFEKIIAKKPDYAPAYREMAETYLRWGREEPKLYEEKINLAVKNYKTYLEKTDLSEESKMRYADFLILGDRWSELEKIAKELAQDKDSNIRIYRYLGYAAFENKNYADAFHALEKFIKNTEPERHIASDYEYYYKSALKSNMDKKFDVAADIRNTLEKYPKLIDFVKEIALEYYKTKAYDKSADLFQIYIKRAEKIKLADFFKGGLASYWAANFSISGRQAKKSDTSTDTKIELSEREDEWFKFADKQFHLVDSVSQKPIEQVYVFRSRIAYFYDQDAKKGLQKPFFRRYVDVSKDKLLTPKHQSLLLNHLKNDQELFNDYKVFVNDETLDIANYNFDSNTSKITDFFKQDIHYPVVFKVVPSSKKYVKNVGAAYSYFGFYYNQSGDKENAIKYFRISNRIDAKNQQADYFVKAQEEFEGSQRAYEEKQRAYKKKLKEYNEKVKKKK